MSYHADHTYHALKEEGGGRSTLQRRPASISGAMPPSTPANSYAAGAREPLRRAIAPELTGSGVKAASSKSWRGSPMPSKTIVPLLRSAESIDKPTASRCMAGKADLSIYTTCANTAARIIHPPRRSTSTNGDVPRGRCQARIRQPSERGPSLEDPLSTSTRDSQRATHADDVWCLSYLQPCAWLRDAKK